LLVVIAIIGILVALLPPAIQAAREAARRSECGNKLKQIALALQNYHDTYKVIPCGGWQDTQMSWLVSVLPFVEQQTLFDQFIFTTGAYTQTGKNALAANPIPAWWFLQSDPEVPEAIRREASQFGWCRDLWPDNGHVPRQVYVRQGRRILGEYVLTQRDGDLDPALQRTRLQPTSIGIVEFAFDSHGTRKFDPAHPGVREGYIYITHPPLQVPYGVLVPRQIDGLLVPVACSASHVGYNAVRMEPVFMALGEASGTAAHLAVRRKVPVRSVPVAAVQHLLV
jgi:type II secretory pathway pseudopilin PulG